MLFCTVLVFFLTSCGESEQTTSTDSDSTTIETTSPEPAMETNTIITTPENMMIVTHKVSDFEKWKASYDEHDSMRLVHGIHSYVIGRGVEDANMVLG
jgi:hypothetical protein